MAVETLGEGWQLGWRVTARCAFCPRDGMKSIRECDHRAELDMTTLVWTRGPNFPLNSWPGGSCARAAALVGWQSPLTPGRGTPRGLSRQLRANTAGACLRAVSGLKKRRCRPVGRPSKAPKTPTFSASKVEIWRRPRPPVETSQARWVVLAFGNPPGAGPVSRVHLCPGTC